MDWILPAILSTLVGTIAISFVYTFLYLNEKKGFLRTWAIGWWLYSIRFVFSFLIQKYSSNHYFVSIEQSTSLLSGLFLLYGTSFFLEKKSIKKWVFAYLILQLWILFSIIFHFSYSLITLPTFIFLGIIYINTGLILFRNHTIHNLEHKAIGLTFIFWGIHKMNYPFFRSVTWFAPFGFFLGALFEFIIAFSFIFIFYKNNKENLLEKITEINDKTILLTETQKISKTGSWELKIKENRLMWSDETYRIFGIKDRSKIIDYDFFINLVHPEDKEKVHENYMLSLKQNKNSYEFQHRIITKEEGEIKIVLERCIHFRDIDGEIIKSIGIIQDITERIQKEKEKEEFERKIFQMQKMESIGQLTGGIAHDFNNQLAAIMGYSEILKRKIDDPIVIKYVDKILKVLDKSNVLTKQLLSFARKGNYNKERIDLVCIVDDVIDILSHSIDKRIIIGKQVDIKNANIFGDYTNIQNAILNIALNAKDAISGKGKILFEIESEVFSDNYEFSESFTISPGNYIKLKITDNGSGMNKETLSMIFEPFFTTKTVGKGTGMGLASVFGIIKSHNGAIEVKSELYKGTSFTVYLQCIENLNLDKNEENKNFIGEKTSKKLSILIIDDNKDFTIVLKEHLTNLNHNVVIYENGTSGIEYYFSKNNDIDLIILDYIMPDISGTEVYYKIKKINPNQKFILASGYSTNENDLIQMINDGCIFLQKPFSIIEFTKKLNSIF